MSHGRQKRGRNRKMKSALEQAGPYLDHLHREDSSQARQWNNAPGQPYRRPRPPAVPRTPQRDGTRYTDSRSAIERVLTGNGPVFYITDRDGNVKMLTFERES
jgi:hypothetical protein